VAEQPAGTLGDVGPNGGRGPGPFGSQPARQGGQQRRRDREASRIQRERRRCGGGEQEPAEGRPDQGGADELDGLEAALARGRPSRSTTIGSAAWEALWNTVSAVVVAKKTTSRTGIDTWPVSTARANSPMQTARTRSAATIN
jgi:hypothetical protein